jgi:adhesin transport system membrane fusion protein
MEKLNNYTINGHNFTIWFFRLVLLMLLTFGALLYLLQINETIKILEGEIVSTVPQLDYKASFEGELVKINVNEGQQVNTGDTLMIIQSPEFISQHSRKINEIDYLNKRIGSVSVQQQDLLRKRNALIDERQLNARKNQLEMERLTNSIKNIEEQVALQRERLMSANEKFAGDSILFKKDMVSKTEYNNSKDERLQAKAALANAQNEKRKQINEKSLAANVFNREQNALLVRLVELDENEEALIQAKNEFDNQLSQSKETSHQIERELNKQYVIATNNGIVNYIFNTTKSSNVISKGDLLVSIAPKDLDYYAKAIIAQKDIPYLRSGLQARLKLDAYYHFEHGLLKGKVSYLAERKENEKFYALIQLPDSKTFQLKSGYSVQGEIVIRRVPLYKYLIKKLFKRMDK